MSEPERSAASATSTADEAATYVHQLTGWSASGRWTSLRGVDYTAASGTLTFPAGITSASFSITVLGDTANEPTETLPVTFSAANALVTISADASVAIEVPGIDTSLEAVRNYRVTREKR